MRKRLDISPPCKETTIYTYSYILFNFSWVYLFKGLITITKEGIGPVNLWEFQHGPRQESVTLPRVCLSSGCAHAGEQGARPYLLSGIPQVQRLGGWPTAKMVMQSSTLPRP